MTIDELKAKVQKNRKILKKPYAIFGINEFGRPSANVEVIDALVAMLETQEGQIETLEKRLKQHDHPGVV